MIVTVRSDSYGSLEAAKLEQLRADLAAVQELMSEATEQVIVDLSGVTLLGSSFLTQLFDWISTLGLPPRAVILCGDQLGVLQLCAADRWLTVRPDLAAAFQTIRARNPALATASLN